MIRSLAIVGLVFAIVACATARGADEPEDGGALDQGVPDADLVDAAGDRDAPEDTPSEPDLPDPVDVVDDERSEREPDAQPDLLTDDADAPTCLHVIGQNMQSFEEGRGGWTTGGTDTSWERVAPRGDVIAGAADGSYAWVTSQSGAYNRDEHSYLQSQCFDFTSLSRDPVMTFAVWWDLGAGDRAAVELRVDGGEWRSLVAPLDSSNWFNSPAARAWIGESGGWVRARARLAGTARASRVQVRFTLDSDGSDEGDGIAIDALTFREDGVVDVWLTDVSVAAGNCGADTPTNVTVRGVSAGLLQPAAVALSLEIDGSVIATEALPFVSVEPFEYTFSQQADLTALGNHTVRVSTDVIGDEASFNDAIEKGIFTRPVEPMDRFVETFEDGNGGWRSLGDLSTWAWGPPSGELIGDAASGTFAWSTNLGGDHAILERSMLESPCFDTSELTTEPIFQTAVNHEIEACCGRAWVEISVDGAPWQRIERSPDAVGWYDHLDENPGWRGASDGWIAAQTTLEVVGSRFAQLRYVFDDDGPLIAEGLAIDDPMFVTGLATDVATRSVTLSGSDCAGALVGVTARIENLSAVPAATRLELYGDGDLVTTQRLPAAMLPGESITYRFDDAVDLSSGAGGHSVTVRSVALNDGNTSNNDWTQLYDPPVSLSPVDYFTSFESSSGWTVHGTNPSWERGPPAGTFLNSATGGDNVWGTNLDGVYNADELSMLHSPCFDLSGEFADPVIIFDMAFMTESGRDAIWFELSLDGGVTWDRLLAGPAADNWYNSTANQWWHGDDRFWSTVANTLTDAAGEELVQMRFVFSSSEDVFREGVVIDQFEISTF